MKTPKGFSTIGLIAGTVIVLSFGYLFFTVWQNGVDSGIVTIAPLHRKTANTNTNSTANTNAAVNTNTATNANTNSANTNASVAPIRYSAPTGPFSVNTSKVFDASYRRTNDRLITRLAKMDATTGTAVKTAEIRTTDVQETLQLSELPNLSSFQFGTDGDTITFIASNSGSGDPFTGIYRTSFTEPTKIETIIQYDRDNLFQNDIPTINSYLYNAESNTVAFVIAGESGVNNNFVKLINLNTATRTVRDLKSYTTVPKLVGFPSGGALLEVVYADGDQYTEKPKDKWSYDQLRTSDGSVSATKLIVDEAALTPPLNVSLSADSLSPNNSVVGFTRYDQTKKQSVLTFRTLATGDVTDHAISDLYGGNPFLWSLDSGKVVVRTKAGGVVYDLAKGATATITGYSGGIAWYPGNYILYTNNQNQVLSYNPNTKKSVEVQDVKNYYGGYGEMGGGYSVFNINWVNR